VSADNGSLESATAPSALDEYSLTRVSSLQSLPTLSDHTALTLRRMDASELGECLRLLSGMVRGSKWEGLSSSG